jgi:hypothetical protein
MSEVVVRIANHNDFKHLDKVFLDKKSNQGHGYNRSSFQSLLLQESHRVFVAEKESKLSAVAIVCVVDAGSTLAHMNMFMQDSSKSDSVLSTALLEEVYKYMDSNCPRLRRERFVSSCESMTQILLGKGSHHRVSEIRKERGSFSEAFELGRQNVEVPGGISFGRILDKLARESALLLLSKRQAGKYVLENISCFPCHTIIMDGVPYYIQLSNPDAIFEEAECLLGEKGTETEGTDLFAVKVHDQELAPSGRNSPSRRSSSHLISVLDSLHTSLRCMNGSLRGLYDNLLASMPKSFSHGRQLPNSNNFNHCWETNIYTEDPKVFRAHVIDQLRAAVLRVKGRFVFRMLFNVNLASEARKVLKDELGLKILGDTKDTLVVYERQIDISVANGVKD